MRIEEKKALNLEDLHREKCIRFLPYQAAHFPLLHSLPLQQQLPLASDGILENPHCFDLTNKFKHHVLTLIVKVR